MMSLLALLTVAVLAQGPLPVLENVHAVLPPFSVVSRNGELGEEPTPLMVNGRRLEVPRGWSYTGTPGVGALPPFIARYDQPGYRLDVSWINGTAGFAQDGIQLYGRQRYVVRVQYRTALEYTSADYPWVPSDVQVVGRLYTANSGLLELPPFNMAGLAETATVEWVIESTANPYPFVRLEVLFNVQYPIFRGFVFFDRIEVLTAPADYKPDFVIAFQ
jgi:hypothetical protein